MSTVVYKYTVGPGIFSLKLPVDAQVLTVQMQDGVVQMWVFLDSKAPRVNRTFQCVGTGEEFEASECAYIGTVQVGSYTVKHLFEMRRTSNAISSI